MNFQTAPHVAAEHHRPLLDFKYPDHCPICGAGGFSSQISSFLHHILGHADHFQALSHVHAGGLVVRDLSVVCPCGETATVKIINNGLVTDFNRAALLDAHLRSFGTHEAIIHHLREAVLIQAATSE